MAAITEAVESEGLLLVHDQRLPSVTALVAGEPVRGSWWAHPLGNVLYNALGELDDRFATRKLVADKLTLVAPRLWADRRARRRRRHPGDGGVVTAYLFFSVVRYLLARRSAASAPV